MTCLHPNYSPNVLLAQAAIMQGVKVFPCRAADDASGRVKSPLTRRGFIDAVSDLGQLRAWAQQYPNAMYGLPCAPNGVFALDADRHGNGDGVERLRALFDLYCFDWRTVPCIRTPNEGLHVLFQKPADLDRTLGKVAPAIDTRDNGYIILPGSTMADGRQYEILNGTIEQLAEHIAKRWLPSTPEWLRKLVEPKPVRRVEQRPIISMERQRLQLEGILKRVTSAATGERNKLLHWAACRVGGLVAIGSISLSDARALLVQAGKSCGLSDTEVERTVQSGLQRTMSGASYGR